MGFGYPKPSISTERALCDPINSAAHSDASTGMAAACQQKHTPSSAADINLHELGMQMVMDVASVVQEQLRILEIERVALQTQLDKQLARNREMLQQLQAAVA